MRTLRYTVSTVEIDDTKVTEVGRSVRESALIDFLFVELASRWFRLVPPLRVLNKCLATGRAGDSGKPPCKRQYEYEWEPFQIREDEYEEIVQAVGKMPGCSFERAEPPEDVHLESDWAHWALTRLVSKP